MNESAVMVIEKKEFSVAEVREQVVKVQNLMADIMKDGVHYGNSFQGDTKKNLLKPGADKLCFTFRLRSDFWQDIKELPNGHREVLTKCQLFHIESGNKIAEGVGIASTMESKYRWRKLSRKCPKCEIEAIIEGKKEYGGGWVCFTKKGGCGAKYLTDDPLITGQQIGKIENPDIADTYNTVLKISKKRAYVDATITACAASDIFSQDADDLNGNENGHDLAKEALDNESSRPKSQVDEKDEMKWINNEIGKILKAKNPDQLPYFSDKDLDMERAVFNGNADIQAARNQHERLKKELAKREAAFDPVPFDDKPQASQPAESSEEFKNDIPWVEEKKQEKKPEEKLEIF